MNSLIAGFIVLALLVILLTCGMFAYYLDTKTGYSFLNMFPHEMESKNTYLNLFISLLSAIFGGSFAFFSLYKYLFNPVNYISYILGFIIIIIGILIFLEFNITLKHYKAHLFATSLLFALTIAELLFIFVNNIFLIKSSYAFGIISLIVAIGLLITLFISPLKKWMYLDKVEEGNQVEYVRKKISILPLLEWIFIAINVILVVFLGL